MLALVVMLGCSEKQETYTVEYLYENKEIREKVLEECKSKVNTPSDLEKVMQEPNCQNAQQAEIQYAKEFSRTGADKKVQQWE